MNGEHAPHEHSSKNMQYSENRHWLLDKEFHSPNNKKLKIDEIESSYKSSADIVTLFKLELERILNNTKLPHTTIDDIQPFGSRISGIFSDDSDVDINIFIQKCNRCIRRIYASKSSYKKVIKSFANSIRYSQVFIKVIPIIHAKIPIIKCTHKNTGIDCDLSFNNISAVHNSYLLNYIISLDNRIKPVLMKFKTWAKNIGLIGRNGFSSYSLYWLGLFCMQILGIVPSIYDLQKSTPELLVSYWNCAFSKDQQECINDEQKSLTESDILSWIYVYYSSFDFEKYVISPFIGRPILKKNFENAEHLPEELWRYKQFFEEHKEHQELLFIGSTKFNLYTQDPFQLNLNITARVTKKVFEKFIASCLEMKSKQNQN